MNKNFTSVDSDPSEDLPVIEKLGATAGITPSLTTKWLREALGLSEMGTPFPWQKELLYRFAKGQIDQWLDIPTGLGKTGVMAIWLVARALGTSLPRRLVYVVDRRAVVDQATEVAKNLRECVERNSDLKEALGLRKRFLPISTLRGQYVDNQEWLEDPASPAIIVGTVDMIGSRLLFEGYGISRKMRPYHAGLLAVDSLIVLDEAHLVPPFEKLLDAITQGVSIYGPREKALQNILPPFKLLSLSATGRTFAGKTFSLQDADFVHPEVNKRLSAPKHLVIVPRSDQKKLEEELADQACTLVGGKESNVSCIVFCDERKVALATMRAFKGIDKNSIVAIDLFVGGRRVLERVEAAKRLKERGFIAGTKVERTQPAIVFATSAAEVGVDLDADHMVSDLVAWERMVQRLGRVNRRGEGKAQVKVVVDPELPNKNLHTALMKEESVRTKQEFKAVAEYKELVNRIRAIRALPTLGEVIDASTGALRELKLEAGKDAKLQETLDAATTQAPLRPALSRALVDAWSMTSLKEHTGRPEINPWLRGWIENDRPQTAVVWRKYLPLRKNSLPVNGEIETFFEAAPPHTSEILETETYQVVEWLIERARKIASRGTSSPSPDEETLSDGEALRKEDFVAIALTVSGDFHSAWKVEDLALGEGFGAKKSEEALEESLKGSILIVDARIGGLNEGLLDDTMKHPPRTIDDGALWIQTDDTNKSEGASGPVIKFLVRTAGPGQSARSDLDWRERFRFASELSEDGEPQRWLIVEKWRHDATTEEDRSAGKPQLLYEHQAWVEDRARKLAIRLGLPQIYVDMFAISARLHDEGKRAKRWQIAFNAKPDYAYAKTLGPVNNALLDGYRHEFGSLSVAEKDEHLRQLPEDLQDLSLHLIAAHHGFARPLINIQGCADLPPSALEERARQVALRFARLQKRWGPWGLAWWEALLRAADQQASRDNDNIDQDAAKEVD